tara:strand:+ start:677 stop:1006 length:330 start_codon:yes stop_codon:yes gene_type:complete
MRTSRLDKKLHKAWLELGVVDATQISLWREKIFNAEINEVFEIDIANHEGLDDQVVSAIRKYNLQYCVSKIPSSEAEPWLSEGNLVVFKFWAKHHPKVCLYTGNNPSVI